MYFKTCILRPHGRNVHHRRGVRRDSEIFSFYAEEEMNHDSVPRYHGTVYIRMTDSKGRGNLTGKPVYSLKGPGAEIIKTLPALSILYSADHVEAAGHLPIVAAHCTEDFSGIKVHAPYRN